MNKNYFFKQTVIVGFLGLLSTQLIITASHPEHKPILHHKAIAVIDGTPFGLNGQEIVKMLHVLRKIKQMLHGIKQADTNEYVGLYSYEGTMHSIQSLVQLEKMYRDTGDKEKLARLNILLAEIKEEFMTFMKPFVGDAQGSESLIVEIMEDWAEVFNRSHDCFLLTWGKQKEGAELQAFDTTISSFHKLHEFFTDLISFMESLIKSCPRGWKQYLELVKKHSHK